MSRVVVAVDVLTQSLGATPELVRRLERWGLVVPRARDEAGRVWVDAEARPRIERVQSLVAAGYAERDIALVIGRIESAGTDRQRVQRVLSLEGFAAAADLAPATITRWLDDRLVRAWAVDEEGAPLFTRGALADARAIAALEALGLADEAPRWARIANGDAAPAETAELRSRIAAHLARLDRATRSLQKLLPRLLAKAPTAPAAPRRRLLLRRGKAVPKADPKT